MELIFCLLGIVTILSCTSEAKKKPSDFFKLCKLSDQKLSKCVFDSAKEVTPRLLKGIPEMRLQPLDPLFIPSMSLEQGQNNFKLKFIMTNLTITGLKDSFFKEFTADKDFKWLKYTVFTKNMHFEGGYSMDGQILVLPVKGEGKVTFDFYDVLISANPIIEKYEKNGEKYFKCTSYNMKIEPGSAKSYFTNLFNGDKNLEETTNKFFNDNWKETYGTYKELPQQAFGEYFKEFLNGAFSLHPAKDWFLE